LDLTQIRHFLALANALNFTRAAEACNVTQSTLTRSIQRLEEELGGPLLLRERSLTQLTELGRTMLPLLRQTYEAAEAARAHAISFRRQETSPLRIGLDGAMPICAIGSLLRELSMRVKGFELTTRYGTPAALNELLLQSEIDVAVLADESALAERINRWVLCADQLTVLMSGNHPMASLGHVPVSALASETLVLGTEATTPEPPALARLCASLGLELKARHRGANDDHVRQIVGAGLGITIVTERCPPLSDVTTRPLGEPPLCQEVVLAAVAGRPLSRAADIFLRLARARSWAQPAGGSTS
jgi:LysR family hydrogen peroxide-inducible transcriptional activator